MFSGNIYNRVHVVRFTETVPKTYQKKRETVAFAGVEEMVYTDPISA